MKILAFDIATKTGFAVFEDRKLVDFGLLTIDKEKHKEGKYPWVFDDISNDLATELIAKVLLVKPDKIVIEETNGGRARYSIKLLEFFHKAFIRELHPYILKHPECSVSYVSTSDWRKTLQLRATKEDLKNNRKVNEAKRSGLSKKESGVKGKITPKHRSVRYVNETLGLSLKLKDDDIAEAICLGLAFMMGANESSPLHLVKE